jgi:putative serine protease PepD
MGSGPRANFLSALLGGGVVAVVFGALALAGTFDDSGESDGTVTTASTVTEMRNVPAPAATRTVTDVSALYRKVRDGVVYVQINSRGPSPTGDDEQEQGSGSGFVLDKRGYILTNDHVVEDADVVRVRIGESEDLISARVVGTDASSDLAVIKVDPADVEDGLQPLTLGSSGSVQVGQPAIAIGSPFGLQGSLTTGVISALGRPIRAPNGFQISGALQTDAAINPGNSGGPLLDASGNVIGINAQIETGPSGARSNSGVGFAIPIDTAKQAIPALERGERIRRAYLGVSTADSANGSGAAIAQVVTGGPADKAGLRAGDRIVKVGGQEVGDSDDVASGIASRKPGDVVEVVVRRGSDEKTVKVTLGTQPRSVPQPG